MPSTEGTQSYRARRPAAPLQDREKHNGGGRARLGAAAAYLTSWRAAGRRPEPPESPRGGKGHRWSKFRISAATFEDLLTSQHGVCAVCAQLPSGERSLAVDHDHECCPGKTSCGRCVRGLLCGRCNSGVGMFNDDVARLMAAIRYLEKYRL
ncbi:endonuclease VII domain-containing protein [Streptomyces sp. NPDC088400]|uniref:endonuclease VII domain-containing protein n=1 Tax=Streptomyces sp. NPDC088400 TaxID=3365861 RepID=UPI0038116221